MSERVEVLRDKHMQAFEHEFAYEDMRLGDDPMSFGRLIMQGNISDAEASARKDVMRHAEAAFFDRLVETDPTRQKIYLSWLLRIRRRNWVIEVPADDGGSADHTVKGRTYPHESMMGRPLLGEDLTRIHDLLVVFDANKRHLAVEHRDIMQCDGEIELFALVENIVSSDAQQGANEVKRFVRDRAYAESVVHFDESGWLLIEPLTRGSSVFFGRGTRWCTAANRDNAFENYTNDGGRLCITIDPKGVKHQFHLPSGILRTATDAVADPERAFVEAPLQLRFKLAEIVTPVLKNFMRRNGLSDHASRRTPNVLAGLVPGDFGRRFRKSFFSSVVKELLVDSRTMEVEAEGWSVHRLRKPFAFEYYRGEFRELGGPGLDNVWGWPGEFGEASFVLEDDRGGIYALALETVCEPPGYGTRLFFQTDMLELETMSIKDAWKKAPNALREWVKDVLLPHDPIDPLKRLHVARITSGLRQHVPEDLVPAWLMQVWGSMESFQAFTEYRQKGDADLVALSPDHFEPMQVVHRRGEIEVHFADDTVELLSNKIGYLNVPAIEREDGLPAAIVEEAIGIRRGVIDKGIIRSVFAHLDEPQSSISPTPSGNVA
ncbi:MAG: hypothetical protein ABS76_26535 [Pelagibacterium sp. SCN 64-44]|nr:MAG: hypothetical protein ABS76_26535 [Pelagibacterium sp. SCN 64-44]